MPRDVDHRTTEIRALLNRRSAATYLDVSIYTVDRLVKSGSLTPLRLTKNGPFKFRVRDLNAFIEQRSKARRFKPVLRGNVFGGCER